MVLENISLILSTIALVSLLGVIFYTAVVIREEREAYQENARIFSFCYFIFYLPSWWRESLRTRESIRFEKDDWFAQFTELPYSSLSMEETLRDILGKRELAFDRDSTEIFIPYSLRNRPEIREGTLEIVRVEGTATQNGETRVYSDIFLFKDHRNAQCFMCESQSSVLSGMVEGPYFEEAVKNYRFTTVIS